MRVMPHRTHAADVHRAENGVWIGKVRGIPGAHAEAATLEDLPQRLLDAVRVAAEDDDAIGVSMVVTLTPS